jgi:hypothetical protein
MPTNTFSVSIPNLPALQAALAAYPTIAAPIIQSAVVGSQALLAKYTTASTVPVLSGYLVQNWGFEIGQFQARWFPIANYACVFDAHTQVLTNKGTRAISKITVGDLVLTQDGKHHPVLAVNSFPATQKPNLVTIKVSYRKGLVHTLNVTEDHKILVYRIGRNKWVMAGDLKPTDQLFTRIKFAHNEGTRVTHVCLNCQKVHQGQGESFCSVSCRDLFWANGNNPHLGTARTDESREKMSRSAKKRLAANPQSHPNHILAKAGHKTSVERQVEDWLKTLAVHYEIQKRIGTHWVDFYVPAWGTAFECDGSYWHKDQARELARDKELLVAMPELRIVHIHFYDERHSPILTQKPLRHVSYVAVNPNMNSYTDLEQFAPKALISIKRWRYERTRGHKSAMLYDISVEGMHSFFANGVLISNSYVEFGTGPHEIHAVNARVLANSRTGQIFGTVVHHPGTKANPFLERIMNASQPEITALFGQALDKITAQIAAQAKAA